MIGVKINDTANRGTENNFFRTFLAIFQSERYLTRFIFSYSPKLIYRSKMMAELPFWNDKIPQVQMA